MDENVILHHLSVGVTSFVKTFNNKSNSTLKSTGQQLKNALMLMNVLLATHSCDDELTLIRDEIKEVIIAYDRSDADYAEDELLDAAATRGHIEDEYLASSMRVIERACSLSDKALLTIITAIAPYAKKITHTGKVMDSSSRCLLNVNVKPMHGYANSAGIGSTITSVGGASSTPCVKIARHLVDTIGWECVSLDSGDVRDATALKQVFFPVDAEHEVYHIITPIVSPAFLRVLGEMIYGEASAAKEAYFKKKEDGGVFRSVPSRIKVKLVGSQPQNLGEESLIRMQGMPTMLLSMPPVLKNIEQSLPSSSIFKQVKYDKYTKLRFSRMAHALYRFASTRNASKENMLRETVISVLEPLIYRVSQVQGYEAGWSDAKVCNQLDKDSRNWLDSQYNMIPSTDILNKVTAWVVNGFSYDKARKAMLEDGERETFTVLKTIVDKTVLEVFS